MSMGAGVVIIGGGQAGQQCAETLRAKGYGGTITLIGEESDLPYQRPPLSKAYLMGEMDEDRLAFRKSDFYLKKAIDLRLGVRVVSIDRSQKMISFSNGDSLSYDKLVLATGSRVRTLPGVKDGVQGVFTIRTIDDARALKQAMAGAKTIGIIGAGFIGLEAAAVARKMGKAVHVVEMSNRVMGRAVAPVLSHFYQQRHVAEGVKFHLTSRVDSVEIGAMGQVSGLRIEMETVPIDLLIVGIGVIANDELAVEAGLEVDNGILVNEQGQTSDPDIFAAGECTRHPNSHYGMVRLESVQNAVDQAMVVAEVIATGHGHYDVVPWFWSDQYDLKLQMVGLSDGYDDYVVRGDKASNKFSILYYKENKLIAVDSINNAADHIAAKKLLAAGISPAKNHVVDATQKLKSFLKEPD